MGVVLLDDGREAVTERGALGCDNEVEEVEVAGAG